MIDPFHLEAYDVTTVNYNRDVEIFPVLRAIFQQIFGESPYKSPTDMGVNMAGNCIVDDAACCEASRQEIIRRYYNAVDGIADGSRSETEAYKIELLMKQENIVAADRTTVSPALVLSLIHIFAIFPEFRMDLNRYKKISPKGERPGLG